MGSNKYIITKNKCWPVFKQDPSIIIENIFYERCVYESVDDRSLSLIISRK